MNDTPRTLDELIEFCNEHNLGWKSRVEICHDHIERLECKLDKANAEIEALKTELRENAESCSNSSASLEWCKACTSRHWCRSGTLLVEAAERKTNELL
jgi:chromosome segregation ATPase